MEILLEPTSNKLMFDSNYLITNDKHVECITVVNDDDEKKSATCHESEKLATSLQVLEVADASDSKVRSSDDSEHKVMALVNDDITVVKASPLTSKDVPKVAFDLNLHHAATDADVQPIEDDDAILRDPQLLMSGGECGERSEAYWWWQRVEKMVVGRMRYGGVMVVKEVEWKMKKKRLNH
nr:acyl-CoA N-acyltransferase with RING/FYVE/PHD-type zinc finger protein [Tanacetum cinerariifolium]